MILGKLNWGFVISKMDFKNKKSQLVIFSGLILILFLVFIYSQETQNNYIVHSQKNNILNNIIFETCYIGTHSNGSNIDERFLNFSSEVFDYCNGLDYYCNLTINNIDGETNESILSYKNYSYYIDFRSKVYNYSGDFNC